jgi:hypothetical protein
MDQIDKDEVRRQVELENKIETAKLYAKKKCKDCLGRGYYLVDMINKNRPLDKYLQYCSCVYKNMKKYS